MKYFNLATATELHNIMIAKIGGSSGHNDTKVGYLDSALQNIQDDMYYPKGYDKVAHLMFSCVKFHPFSDDNKRTSILLASAFLAKNDIKIDDEKFFITMEDIVVKIATNEVSKDELKNIFKAFIYGS